MTNRAEFEAWRAKNADAELTDWLCEISEPDWTASVSHPFTDALANGSLARETFARYLVQDYGFVDPFTALLGFAIGRAPSMADRVVLGQFVGMLTSTENTFFERAFEAFGVTAETRRTFEYLGVTQDFRHLLTETSEAGSYVEMLAVLVVTEKVYLDWAQRIDPDPNIDPFYGEWIHLHNNADFERFVGWLCRRLNEEGRDLAPEPFQRVVNRFRQAVMFERRFFEACWTGREA